MKPWHRVIFVLVLVGASIGALLGFWPESAIGWALGIWLFLSILDAFSKASAHMIGTLDRIEAHLREIAEK